MSQWQYLEHVEPVLPIPRAGDARLQWQPELPDLPPDHPIGMIAAVLATTLLAFVPPVAAAPVPRGWEPSLEVSVLEVEWVASAETGAERPSPVAAAPLVRGWEPSIEVPILEAEWVSAYETGAERPSRVIPRAAVVGVDWYPAVDLPPIGLPPIATIETGAERPLLLVAPSVVPSFGWYQPLALPEPEPVLPDSVFSVTEAPAPLSTVPGAAIVLWMWRRTA